MRRQVRSLNINKIAEDLQCEAVVQPGHFYSAYKLLMGRPAAFAAIRVRRINTAKKSSGVRRSKYGSALPKEMMLFMVR